MRRTRCLSPGPIFLSLAVVEGPGRVDLFHSLEELSLEMPSFSYDRCNIKKRMVELWNS